MSKVLWEWIPNVGSKARKGANDPVCLALTVLAAASAVYKWYSRFAMIRYAWLWLFWRRRPQCTSDIAALQWSGMLGFDCFGGGVRNVQVIKTIITALQWSGALRLCLYLEYLSRCTSDIFRVWSSCWSTSLTVSVQSPDSGFKITWLSHQRN